MDAIHQEMDALDQSMRGGGECECVCECVSVNVGVRLCVRV